MKRIDSDALGLVNRSLGMTGAGAPETELHDGEVFQVVDVSQSARRGRVLAGTTGIFTGLLRNIHLGSGDLTTTVNPYDAIGGVAPFPVPIPQSFDLWLLSAAVRRNSGTGTLLCNLEITYPFQGFGLDDMDVAVVATLAHPVALWDAIVTSGSISFGVLAGSELPEAILNRRLPRATGAQLTFRSTASAISTYSLQLVLGLFPISLGQDGAF